MAIGNVISFSQGIAKIVTLAQLQNRDAWERAFQNKCKDHRYYEIVDETLEGDFEHHYVVLEDDSGNVRAIQPVFFVRQNLVEGVPGKIRSVVDLVRKRFPRFLTMRVLMVGCAAGAGDLGTCDEKDEAWVAAALLASLRNYARQNKASLIVLKDFTAKYRAALETFRSNVYARIPSMPMTRLALHYQTWDEYFCTLSKATRKDLRRKFRKAERAPKIDMEIVSDLTPNVDEAYPLYLEVHERSPLKFETLTKDYFRAIGQRMPERARFFIWRQNGKHAARHHLVVAATRIKILLQQPIELRTQTAPPLRARAARLVRHAYERVFESDLPPYHQVSRTNPSRSDFATISKRRSALSFEFGCHDIAAG